LPGTGIQRHIVHITSVPQYFGSSIPHSDAIGVCGSGHRPAHQRSIILISRGSESKFLGRTKSKKEKEEGLRGGHKQKQVSKIADLATGSQTQGYQLIFVPLTTKFGVPDTTPEFSGGVWCLT
jgi:hypothetical protein